MQERMQKEDINEKCVKSGEKRVKIKGLKYWKYLILIITAAILMDLYYFIHMEDINRAQALWVLVFTLICGCGIFLAKKLPVKVKKVLRGEHLSDFLYSEFSDTALFVQVTLISFVCFMPSFLAFFPGILGYDTPAQLMQVYGYEPLSKHHPFAHSMLLGAMVKLGEAFGNPNVGLMIYTLLQIILLSVALGYCFILLKRFNAPITAFIIGYILTVFNRSVQLLSMNATKDIIFGVFIFLFALSVMECAFEKEEPEKKSGAKASKATYIRLFLTALATCMFRNQGVYIVLLMALFLLIFRFRRKKAVITVALAGAAHLVLMTVCTLIFSLEPGNMREMLSVPLQQAGFICSYALDGDDTVNITDEEIATILEVIPEEYIRGDKETDTADFLKSGFDTEVFKSSPFKYISCYFSVGVKNAEQYFYIYRSMILPYFDMSLCNYRFLTTYFYEDNVAGLYADGKLAKFAAFIEDGATASAYPFFKQPGLGLWILIVLLAVCVTKKKAAMLVPAMPVALYLLTAFVGPVALLRYLYPLMISMPLILPLLFVEEKE